jgi:hypothetical protein
MRNLQKDKDNGLLVAYTAAHYKVTGTPTPFV